MGFLILETVLLFAAAAQSAASGAPVPPAAVEPVPATDRDEVPIIVTGTRIKGPDRTSASPVESVRQVDFELTGVPNVEQTLNQLPQLVPSYTSTSNNPGTGAATLDLRGLGSVRTLILVNGRRWIANDAGQVPEIDVNTIPSALIDRVDIVTGGASAVYGSDAVTGVINFVLKPRLDGLHLEARNSITERGDARSSSADLSYGTTFGGGRGNLIASIGTLDQSPVFQGGRDYTRFALVDSCVIPGTENKRFGYSTPAPNPSELCDGAGEELGFIRGGSSLTPAGSIRGLLLLPGPGTRLRPGGNTRFTPSGDLVRFNNATDLFNYAPENYLQVPLTRYSGNLLASYEISSAFQPYTELSFIRTLSPQQFATAPGALGFGAGTVPVFRINLDNPFISAAARQALDTSYGVDAEGDRGFRFIPGRGFSVNPAFGGDADNIVSLSGGFFTRLTGLGPRQAHNKRTAFRILAGVRGELSPSWDYDAYFSASSVRHVTPFSNSASASRLQQAILARRDPVSGQITCIDPSNGCVPVNIFGVQDISSAAAEFIRATVQEETRVKEQVAELTVRGPLLELPAGMLSTVFGAEWRHTSFAYKPDRTLESGDNIGFEASTGSAGTTRVFELFGEALIPLLKDRPLAQSLNVELGLRFSKYDTTRGVWTWKSMLNWRPMDRLRVRAGLQKAVRAPNVRELYEERTTLIGGLFDACAVDSGLLGDPRIVAACAANGGSGAPSLDEYAALITTGGSPDLRPETARTVTIGAVAQPLSGLSISLDYYAISIRDVIGSFGGGPSATILGCLLGDGGDPASNLCRAFTRDETGAIVSIASPTANMSNLSTRGIDWQLSYLRPILGGDLAVNLSGTRTLNYRFSPNDRLNPIECGGAFGAPCGRTILGTSIPKFKMFNRVAYSLAPVTLTLRHRFFSKTRNASFAVADAQGTPLRPRPARAVWLAARHYFDLAATFDFAARFGLTLGVNNITNAKPSLLGGDQIQANTDPSLYDVLGRRFFMSVKASW